MRGRLWPSVLLLALAAAACYANSLDVPFLFDDPLPKARLDYSTRPLVWASFALNRALSGEHVWSYHVFNVLVHLACALLLLGLLRRTIARAAPGLAPGTQAGLALVTTLVWLCHPLQTESVTYLSQRAESMGAFFYLACLYAFVRSTSARRPLPWQALALLALLAGFATKETIATVPLVLWLYDATFVEAGPRRALERRRRFYLSLAGTTAVAGMLFVFPLLVAEQGSAGFGLREHGPLEYARSQPGVVLHYLRLAFWPQPLVLDYGWPVAESAGDYVPQAIVVLALLAAALVLLLRRSWIGFAAAWFFVILAPTSTVVPIRDLAFEHRAYLSLAGVVALAVGGAWWLRSRWLPRARHLSAALSLVLIASLAGATVRRNQEYRSPIGLWQTVVERAPGNPRGHSNLAHEYIEAGEPDQAFAPLHRAIELDPTYHFAHHRLGNAHLLRGEWDLAIEWYEKAIALSDSPASRGGLGTALFKKGQSREAEPHFRKAIEMDPDEPKYHYYLGLSLAQLGRPDEAIQEYERALAMDAETQDVHTNLGALLSARGDPTGALEHYRKALAILPNTAEEQFNFGQCLVTLGRSEQGVAALREAIRLAPGLAEPYAALAKALCAKEDASPAERAEALQMAQKANALAGAARADILETLALAHAANRDYGPAIELVQKALGLPGPTRNAVFRERLQAQLERYRRDAGEAR